MRTHSRLSPSGESLEEIQMEISNDDFLGTLDVFLSTSHTRGHSQTDTDNCKWTLNTLLKLLKLAMAPGSIQTITSVISGINSQGKGALEPGLNEPHHLPVKVDADLADVGSDLVLIKAKPNKFLDVGPSRLSAVGSLSAVIQVIPQGDKARGTVSVLGTASGQVAGDLNVSLKTLLRQGGRGRPTAPPSTIVTVQNWFTNQNKPHLPGAASTAAAHEDFYLILNHDEGESLVAVYRSGAGPARVLADRKPASQHNELRAFARISAVLVMQHQERALRRSSFGLSRGICSSESI